MLLVWYMFLLVSISSCLEDEISVEVQKSSDSVLCRYCGGDILKTESIISKFSPNSLDSFNDTVFNREPVLVQVLSNKDFIVQIPIITSTHSACLGIGEWEEDDYWFPGYHWRTCVCSECGALLGWIFEPMDPVSVVIPEQFFGLILPQLASETCNYNLSRGFGLNCVVLCHVLIFLSSFFICELIWVLLQHSNKYSSLR